MERRRHLVCLLTVLLLVQLLPMNLDSSQSKDEVHYISENQLKELNHLDQILKANGRSSNFAQTSWNNLETFGGINNDIAFDAKLGPWGTVYVTGTFENTMTLGSTTLTTASHPTDNYNDIFVARLNASGTWDWAVRGGGTMYNDRGHSIVVADDGSAYVHGLFYGQGTTTFGSISPASTQQVESFVGKVSNAGVWEWVTPIHGSMYQYSGQISLDSSGDVIVCGSTSSQISLGSYTVGGSGWTIYLAKLSSSNGAFTNGIDVVENSGVTYRTVCNLDSNNNVYIASEYKTSSSSSASVPGVGNFQSSGNLNVIIAKVDSSFSILWAEQFGSTGDDYVRDILIDTNNDIYITGSVPATTNFGSNQITASDETGYIAKMNSARTWQWVEVLGSSGKSGDIVNSIEILGDRLVVTGNVNDGAQFGSQTYSSPSTTTPGMFMAQYYTNGTPIWIDGYGGNMVEEKLLGIDIDNSGNILVAGSIEDYSLSFGNSNTQTPNNIDAIFGIMVDFDRDGILNDNDDCSFGKIGWISSSVTDHDSDGCEDASEDQDDDNDGIEDSQDNCNNSLNWESNSINDYDSDGCDDSSEDMDDDNDGIGDVDDDCQTGLLFWQSDSSSDYDSDGCKDVEEDSDDDNDGIQDNLDTCSKGTLNWISDSTTDTDGDGCRDIDEDDDDDSDGVFDSTDDCIAGVSNWVSDSTTDYDSDGCRDSDEDDDDDSDNIIDLNDYCQTGKLGWTSTGSNDYDSDGCFDDEEDDDDDNDNVSDTLDSCARGSLNWISNQSTDYDSDGCKDNDEDNDDDNDSVFDILDDCSTGTLGWNSSSSSDYDSDGCQDSSEDSDDDNDGILDLIDSCSDGVMGWTSNEVLDKDGDGCRDLDEDTDDDNDGIEDAFDQCSAGETNWTSNSSLDYDADGCRDLDEDSDDDKDGIPDLEDSCPLGQNDWISDSMNDYDSDGCQDSLEDLDDDNDGVEDTSDTCQTGTLGWTSNKTLDYDLDGCRDSDEDDDDDDDRVLDSADECKESALQWDSNDNTDLNRNGCPDELDSNQEVNSTIDDDEIETSEVSFLERLEQGDLDAIGIIVAIILPILGLCISVLIKRKKINIVNSFTTKINNASSLEELNQISAEIDTIIANDKISHVQYQSLRNIIEPKKLNYDESKVTQSVTSSHMDSDYKYEIGEQSVKMQDSVIGGDSFVGSTNIESQVYNDPTAIAKAAIEAYKMGAESKSKTSNSNQFVAQFTDENGYEWHTSDEGSKYFRPSGSEHNWTLYDKD